MSNKSYLFPLLYLFSSITLTGAGNELADIIPLLQFQRESKRLVAAASEMVIVESIKKAQAQIRPKEISNELGRIFAQPGPDGDKNVGILFDTQLIVAEELLSSLKRIVLSEQIQKALTQYCEEMVSYMINAREYLITSEQKAWLGLSKKNRFKDFSKKGLRDLMIGFNAALVRDLGAPFAKRVRDHTRLGLLMTHIDQGPVGEN